MTQPAITLSRRLVCAAIAITLIAVAVAAAAPAHAAVTVGIAENQPQMFADPLFQRLGVKQTRLVASYNVMTSGDDELARVTEYLQTAHAAGIDVLMTFEHARGDATVCIKNSRRNRRQCRLPSATAYRRNIKLFLEAFPYVRTIAPWNEVNHFTQPTARNPRAAARFTNIVRAACRRCKVVVGDILDQADGTSAKRPTFRSTIRYIKRFRRNLRVPRTICGIHNYSDTNRFRMTGTRAIIKALGCRQIWLTETGGLYKFGRSFPRSERRQARATSYMFRLARSNRKIRRLFVYNWFGKPRGHRFDAGLVHNGRPRRAYAVVERHVH
jgi:hypothetical protein